MTPRPPMPERAHVMACLEQARRRAGSTYEELASACGVTKQAMSRRFDQERNISVGAAAEIAEALGYELVLAPKGGPYARGAMRVAPILADKHRLGGRR